MKHHSNAYCQQHSLQFATIQYQFCCGNKDSVIGVHHRNIVINLLLCYLYWIKIDEHRHVFLHDNQRNEKLGEKSNQFTNK